MMAVTRTLRPWLAACVLLWLTGALLLTAYGNLPADGASGDLESFSSQGYRVQWLLDERPQGLHVNDVIIRAGGRTIEEWLAGAPRGPEWHSGGTVIYDIERNGTPLSLAIDLAPVPFFRAAKRWLPQLVVAVAFVLIGVVVGLRRPEDPAARVLMLFCTAMTLQILGDTYNIQASALPWPWLFWGHIAYEHVIYGLSIASVTWFGLVFPAPHPWLQRAPRLLPAVLILAFPVIIGLGMTLAANWPEAVRLGNRVGWLVSTAEVALAFAAGMRSIRVARDPVARAQTRWILWCGAIGCGILLPGYVLPLTLLGGALLPHSVIMVVAAFVPFTLAVAILRFHLFDIQVLVNRSLVYASMTVLLALLYLGLVRLVTWVASTVWQGESEALAVFVGALAVIAAFDPLRRRVKRVIDLTFYRSKQDYEQLLAEMSDKLSTSIVLEDVALLLTREIPARLQIDGALLGVLSPQEDAFLLAPGDAVYLPVDHCLPAYLNRVRRPLLRLQPETGTPAAVLGFQAAARVELSVPLLVGGRLAGLYNLRAKYSGEGYSGDEVRTLQRLGQQAAVAVENSRLFEATSRQAAELAGLHAAAVAISSSLEIEGVLGALAEQLGNVTQVSNVCICQMDRDLEHSTVLACWSAPSAPRPPQGADAPGDAHALPAGLERLAANEVVALQAAATDLEAAARASLARYRWHSALVVPLIIRGELVGYAELWESRGPRAFGPGEVRVCRTLAADAAAAIDRARLFQGEREQRRLAEALAQATDLVSRSLDLDLVLDRILEQVERVVAGDAFNVMLVEDDTIHLVRWRGYRRTRTQDAPSTRRLPITHFAHLTTMMASGQPTVVPDTAGDPNWVALPGWEWVRSCVSAPIQVAGVTVGFLNADHVQPARFGADDARRLESFAQHVATALEHARLYQQARQEIAERRRAEERQKVSLAEKEVLLQEIHHRVKNNLQVISSLLYLQGKGLDDPKVLAMLHDSQHRVRSMALIHEQLYQSGNLGRVEAAEYVRTLASYLFGSYHDGSGRVRLRLDVEPGIYWGLDTAAPCGLLISELLSNAFKHAFPQERAGEVYVQVRAQNGQCCLVVGDDGAGFPPGISLEPGTSLGLQLVKTLVGQLSGSLALDSRQGTRFEIWLPLVESRGGE